MERSSLNFRSAEKTAGSLTVADALVLTLREWGVESVFGVSGANIEDFHDSIYRHGDGDIVSVAARSESGAAFMADAQARAGAPLAVCCSTSGGGMMNLAVGIAESFQEGIPVLAIVGQIPTGLNGVGGFQDSSGKGHTVHAEQMWSAISKSVRVIDNPATFWDDFKAIVTSILSPRRGPGVLLVPKDIFQQTVPCRPHDWPTRLDQLKKPVEPSEADMLELVTQLSQSTSPVFIVGSSVRYAGAHEAVVELARDMQVPVMTTLSDVAAYPNTDPLFLGVVGTAGHPSAHRYINEEADLIVVLGSHLEIMQRAPIIEGLQRARLIFVNEEVGLSQSTFAHASVIACDILKMVERLRNVHPTVTTRSGRPADYRHQEYAPLLAEPVSEPQGTEESLLQSEAIGRLQEVLPDYQRLIFDAGNCAASALHYLESHDELKTSIALGMGGMGYAIPAAVGASMLDAGSERTIVLCGDGAFLILGMEIHTAVELGLPILFVVFNNAKHGMCVTRQQVYFEGRVECAQYPEVSVATLSRGFGHGDALWVGQAETLADLDAALADLKDWAWSGPAVLELTLRREEVPPFAPFLPQDAPIIDKQPEEGSPQHPRQPRAA